MRAPRRTHRWQLATLTLLALGTLPLFGCDALQTGALKGTAVPAKPGLKLTLLGDFAPLRAAGTDSRFGRLEIRSDKLTPTVLRRADLAAALKGTKPIEGVSVTDSELVISYTGLEPGAYSVSVVLYDQAEGGTKLSDNTFAKQLELGVLEAVRLDLTAAIAATAPAPAPTPTPTPAPTEGNLSTRVDLIGNGDGVAHPLTLNGTLVQHFGMPTSTGARWVYEATQSVYQNATDWGTSASTRSVTIQGAGAVQFQEEFTGGGGYTVVYPGLTQVGNQLRNFGTLGSERLQATGATRSFTVSGTAYVGQHFLLTAPRYLDEDPTPNWPAPVSTHTFDLWYVPGVGLLESRDTVYLSDGRVKAGLHLRLRTFQPGS